MLSSGTVLRDHFCRVFPNALAITDVKCDESECLFLHKFPQFKVKLCRYMPSRHRGGGVGRCIALPIPTPALEGVGGQLHASAALLSGKVPRTHCTGDWMGLETGVNGCRKSRPTPTGIQTPDRPARSESLYLPRYPGQRIP